MQRYSASVVRPILTARRFCDRGMLSAASQTGIGPIAQFAGGMAVSSAQSASVLKAHHEGEAEWSNLIWLSPAWRFSATGTPIPVSSSAARAPLVVNVSACSVTSW